MLEYEFPTILKPADGSAVYESQPVMEWDKCPAADSGFTRKTSSVRFYEFKGESTPWESRWGVNGLLDSVTRVQLGVTEGGVPSKTRKLQSLDKLQEVPKIWGY